MVPSGQERNRVEKKTKASQQKGSQGDQQMKSISINRKYPYEGPQAFRSWYVRFPTPLWSAVSTKESVDQTHSRQLVEVPGKRCRQKSSEDALPAGECGLLLKKWKFASPQPPTRYTFFDGETCPFHHAYRPVLQPAQEIWIVGPARCSQCELNLACRGARRIHSGAAHPCRLQPRTRPVALLGYIIPL